MSRAISAATISCAATTKRAPGQNTWKFNADIAGCDVPDGLELGGLAL